MDIQKTRDLHINQQKGVTSLYTLMQETEREMHFVKVSSFTLSLRKNYFFSPINIKSVNATFFGSKE